MVEVRVSSGLMILVYILKPGEQAVPGAIDAAWGVYSDTVCSALVWWVLGGGGGAR